MKKFGLIVVLIFVVANLFSQNYDTFKELKENIISKTIPLISVEDLRAVENTTAPLLILDAREIKEFNVSHIKKAEFVGYDNFTINTLKDYDKDATIVVYCSVGYRSEKIGEQLKKIGFKKVLNLKGGIFDWVNKGYPVYDNAGNQTTRVHTYNEAWSKWLLKGKKVYE